MRRPGDAAAGAITAPLVPDEVDLRDFPYMPLDVVRLRDSDLAALSTAEEFRCAVLLWCASWHQVPAGSLPDDDKVLANLAGFGRAVREWKKVRAGALRGWQICDNGRLYHKVVAEKAVEAWEERLKQRWRTECARIKKAAQRTDSQWFFPTFEEWREHLASTGQDRWSPAHVPGDNPQCPRDVPGETPSKGREGKGREGNVLALGNNPSANRSQQGASAHALALRGVGYSDCSPDDPELLAARAEGITPDELAAAAKDRPGKPLAWVVARARGRRADAAERSAKGSTPVSTPPPLDQAERELIAAAQRLDAELRQIRHDCDVLGLFDTAERDRRLAAARAAAAPEGAREVAL